MKVIAVSLIVLSLISSIHAQTFGRHLLSEFSFEPSYVNLNHGSFGSVPKSVQTKQREMYELVESKPDDWFRVTYREILKEARQLVSDYVQSNSTDDIVLVENASSAVNAVFRSLDLKKGDKILIMNRAYPMVKNTLRYLTEREGIEVVEVTIHFPLSSNEDILNPISQALEQHGSSIKIASFSHIESTPGVILPILELSQICKKYQVRVLVDAAHAIGQIPINLKELEVDYYTANLHKWLYGPKGVAFLWVRKEYQSEVVPTVLGSEFSGEIFVNDFQYTGTRDYTGFASVSASFRFRERFGDMEIMKYMHDLAWWAGNHLANVWGTSLIVPEYMCGSMIDILLPVQTYEEGQTLKDTIYQNYNTYFVIYEMEGKVYTRLSAQIFLEQSDFELFGQRVIETLNQIRKTNIVIN